KTIGEDYTEERIKERILAAVNTRSEKPKSRVKMIIDVESNPKVKESKGYEFWAKKHNLKVMAGSVIFLREQGI
ncbi:endonuclease, partial [Eggerthella lenta]|nr:endonuclease [Eggerthella lenta]